jgi:putative RNA 2'-phosphotransferase
VETRDTQLSKFLSLVLRHRPDTVGVSLDPQGWVLIDELLQKSTAAGMHITRDDLLRVVEASPKQRFSVSADGLRIRASQGHSVAVDLALSPQTPPKLLYHGTATRSLPSILSEGLKPQSRRQVHLSVDEPTALLVGQRHGKPTVLIVDAAGMHAQGFDFFRADNGVWLTDYVPPDFLSPRSSSAADSAITSRHPKPSR